MKEKKTAIVTDTNSGLTAQQAEEQEIYLVPMPVIIDGDTYFEDVSISQEEFFTRLRQGADVSTSQPAPGDLLELWDHLLERYKDIVYLPMSSGLSGSCESARILASEYGGKVYVADNHRISVTLRQSVLEAKYMAEQGTNAGEIVRYLETDGPESSIYIAVNTLELLKKSGRVTAAGAAIGTVLNIKPVLQIQGGKLDAFKKVRGMKAAMRAMIEGVEQDQKTRFSGQRLTIRAAYSGDAEQGELWRAELQKAFPEFRIEKDPLPLSIACHTGEGALGVGIMKNIF